MLLYSKKSCQPFDLLLYSSITSNSTAITANRLIIMLHIIASTSSMKLIPSHKKRNKLLLWINFVQPTNLLSLYSGAHLIENLLIDEAEMGWLNKCHTIITMDYYLL